MYEIDQVRTTMMRARAHRMSGVSPCTLYRNTDIIKVMKQDKELNKLVGNITKWLDIETLETQHCGEDFHELAVWQIKEIIEESYKKGVETSSGFSYDINIT